MSFSTSSRGSRQNFSEINITPLTDVFLVLLVIMFLIAPLLDDQTSLKIDPPSARSSNSSNVSEHSKAISIELNKNGEIAVNGEVLIKAQEPNEKIYETLYKKISELAPIGNESNPNNSKDPENKPKVKLKADNEALHGRVVAIYDAVALAKSKNQVGQLVLVTVKPAE